MKNERCMVKLLPLLKALLLHSQTMTLGVSFENGKLRFVCIDSVPTQKTRLLAWGNRIPLPLRMLFPMVAVADTGMVPVKYVRCDTGTADPDAWIDENEERLLPAGFAATAVTTGYAVRGSSLVSMTAVTAPLDSYRRNMEKQVVLSALHPPFAGLAQLYRAHSLPGRYCIWNVEDCGSRIGVVTEGVLAALCHFYASKEDVAVQSAQVCIDLLAMVQSLTGEEKTPALLVIPREVRAMVQKHLGNAALETPVLPQIPEQYHAAYGNALPETSATVNILPFGHQKAAERIRRTSIAVMAAIRTAAVVITTIAAIASVCLGICRMQQDRDRVAMAKVQEQYTTLLRVTGIRDSLLDEVQKMNTFTTGESVLTRLVSDLQEAFPEGVRAEEISVVEKTGTAWRLIIQAHTVSSSLLQPFMDRIAKLHGCSDVRMIYSEKVDNSENAGAMRCKIEALWR